MTDLALVRAAHFASLMTVFGADSLQSLFRAHLADPPAPKCLRRVLPWLGVAALVTAAIWFVMVAVGIAGASDPASLWAVATQTVFGRAALVRLALLSVLVLLLFADLAAVLRVVLAGAALAAVALTGHAAASGGMSLMPLRAGVDAVHLLTAGFWVGSLAVLIPLALRSREPAALLPPLQVFSRWAVAAVALLIAAGSLNAWLILSDGQGHWSGSYISLLAAKIVLAGIMLALALTNRFHLMPAIRKGERESVWDLFLTMSGELILGIFIIVIVGFLGILSPWTM